MRIYIFTKNFNNKTIKQNLKIKQKYKIINFLYSTNKKISNLKKKKKIKIKIKNNMF